ncbi:MAG: hypothetical protein IJC54_05355 [Clostridia bacterium]|nr:hypothetical protein [Clostridia bacterium]MBQ4085979.1 hypothetical protein [Clostridia bacterium]
MKNWLKGWLGIGKDKNGKGKPNTVYAPVGNMDARKMTSPNRGGMDATVVPSTGLEWMDEKNQK